MNAKHIHKVMPYEPSKEVTELERKEQVEYRYINDNYSRGSIEWLEARVRHYTKWAIIFYEVRHRDAPMMAEGAQENGYDAFYRRYDKPMPNFTSYAYRDMYGKV